MAKLTLKDIANELKSKLQQGVSSFSQTLPPVQAYNAVKQIPQIPQMISSIPYKLEENKINKISQSKIPLDWSNQPEKQSFIDKTIANAPKWGTSFVPEALKNIGGSVAPNPDSWTGSFDPVGQMKGFSHPLQLTYDRPKINVSPQLEQIKQRLISGLKPEAREFLSKIPIQFDNGMKVGNLGQSRYKGTPSRNIAISDTFNKPINRNLPEQRQAEIQKYTQEQLETVIKHELLHQTPRLVPTELFKPQNKVVIEEYTQRWGDDYMKERPDALVEEMFAEESLPPAYYWHIFKKVNPKATKKNFIDIIKSYFVNNINTPESPVMGTAPTLGKKINKGRMVK